jgi:hypothetical protein
MRYLRQKHRAEFAGADQGDADGLSSGKTGVEQMMKIHGGLDPIERWWRGVKRAPDI